MPASAQVFEAALIRVVVTVTAAEAAGYSTRQGMLASICVSRGTNGHATYYGDWF